MLSPRLSRPDRILRHPAVLVVAALWLLIDFALLPNSAGVKQWLRKIGRQSIPQLVSPPPPEGIDVEFVVWREKGTVHLQPSGNLPTSVLGFVNISGGSRTRGWWAPTSQWHGFAMPHEQRSLLDDPEIKAAVIQRVELWPSDEAHACADWLRYGGSPTTRSLWAGHFRNSVALIAAMIVLIAVVRVVCLSLRPLTSRYWITRGFCPKCRYNLRNRLDDGCPECGWRRDAPDAASPENRSS